jgi:hypothetical protein
MQDLLEEYMDSAIQEINIHESDKNLFQDFIEIQEGVYLDVLTEKAKFNFAIKFKDDKETKDLWKATKEAEDFLNDEGIQTPNDWRKGWNIVFKVFRVINNVVNISDVTGTGIKLTMLAVGAASAGAPAVAAGVAIGGTIGLILTHLVYRLIDWGFRHGQGEEARRNAKKVRTQLIDLQKKCKDKASKDRIAGFIDKLDDKLEKYENE